MASASEPAAPHHGPVTVINVFEIPAGQVDKFIAWWHTRAQIMAAAPGFRDARLHRAVSSRARFQLVNVAHWDSKAAHDKASASGPAQDKLRALREDPQMRAFANPAIYEVVAELGESPEPPRDRSPARRRLSRSSPPEPNTAPTNSRASRPRFDRPASVTLSRAPAPAISAPAFPAARIPGNHTGRRADTGMDARLGGKRQGQTAPGTGT
jgi:heme-degrading monooxygenase HmoA